MTDASNISDFETVLTNLGDTMTRANIEHIHDNLSTEELKEGYRNYIVTSFYENDFDHEGLFWPKSYPELEDIHLRISYRKHNQVSRTGSKCVQCKSTNTFSFEQQRAAADEEIPTRTICYDCGKQFVR